MLLLYLTKVNLTCGGKCIVLVEAAELEVKTAAQQHGTKLWKDLVEDMQENTDNDQNEPPTT